MKTFVSISRQCSQALVVLFQMQQGSSSQCDNHVESMFNEEVAENRTIPQKFYTLSSEDIHILRFLVIFGVFLSLSATFSNILIFKRYLTAIHPPRFYYALWGSLIYVLESLWFRFMLQTEIFVTTQ